MIEIDPPHSTSTLPTDPLTVDLPEENQAQAHQVPTCDPKFNWEVAGDQPIPSSHSTDTEMTSRKKQRLN